MLDAKVFVQHFGHWCKAVRGARCIGDDVMLFGGRRDDDLLGTRGKMLGCIFAVTEYASGLNYDIDAQLAPRDFGGITNSERFELLAVDVDVTVADFHITGEGAINGVVLQEVGVGFGVHQVIDGFDIYEIAVIFVDSLEHLATDPTKTVDTGL